MIYDCPSFREEKTEARKQMYKLKRTAARLLPNERLAGCQKYPIPVKDSKFETSVHICKHRETQSAFFANLQRCGSVWGCPFCAIKITEGRKAEMITVKQKCDELGLVPYMLTLTFRHNKGEKLFNLLTGFSDALSGNFFNGKFWRKYKKTIGLRHFVKVLEVKHSDENGWHVHIHMLLICEPFDKQTGEFFLEPCADQILLPWQLACKSAGIGVPDIHGVSITKNNAINQYVSKWGIESELTKQHTKKGREGHHTPFDLLRLCALEGNARAGELYKEYYSCFKGRRQMVRSRDFNEFFGLVEFKSDLDLALEKVADSELIGTVNCGQWKIIKFHEAEPEILEAADISGMAGVYEIIDFLVQLGSPFRETRAESEVT